MTRSDQFTVALAWARALPLTKENDRAVREWAESQLWGPESGSQVANVLRDRNIYGVTVRRWWTTCAAGTGGGAGDIVV